MINFHLPFLCTLEYEAEHERGRCSENVRGRGRGREGGLCRFRGEGGAGTAMQGRVGGEGGERNRRRWRRRSETRENEVENNVML